MLLTGPKTWVIHETNVLKLILGLGLNIRTNSPTPKSTICPFYRIVWTIKKWRGTNKKISFCVVQVSDSVNHVGE